MGRLLFLLLLVVAVLAAGTYVAGEQNETVVLRTLDADDQTYETKLWVVDFDGEPWVRVANPDREWFDHLRTNPIVELDRDDTTTRYRAEPLDEPDVSAEIDAAFRKKYGWVDAWYGLLLRRHSIPIRLVPVMR